MREPELAGMISIIYQFTKSFFFLKKHRDVEINMQIKAILVLPEGWRWGKLGAEVIEP